MDKNGTEPMETISWIHLSDLHLSQEKLSAEKDCILKKLFLDIKKREQISPDLKNIDMVFITGDITQSGKEFEVFDKEVLSNILESLELDPEKDKNKVFIVPGNHDVEIENINKLIPSKIKNEESVNRIIYNSECLSSYLKRQNKYITYFKKYFQNNLFINDLSYLRCLNFRNINIAILGLNSSWCAGEIFKNKENRRIADKMILGKAQLENIIKHFDQDEFIVISLIHHDLYSFKTFDETNTIKKLKKVSDFILHGHKHTVDSNDNLYSDVFVLSAGTTDTKDTIGYNYVVLNIKSNKINIFHRKYDQLSMSFVKDKDITDRQFNEKIKSKIKVDSYNISITNYEETIVNNSEFKNYKSILNNPKKKKYIICVLKGNEEEKKKNYNEALIYYNQAKDIFPDFPLTYFIIGYTKLKLGIFSEAIENTNKAISLDTQSSHYYYLLMGDIYYSLQDYNKASENYNKALILNDKTFSAYFNNGLCNMHINQYLEAINNFEKASMLNQDEKLTYFLKSECLLEIGKEKNDNSYLYKAMSELDKLVFIDNNDYKTLMQLGKQKHKIGILLKNIEYLDKAIIHYEKALLIKPNKAQVFYAIGETKFELGVIQKDNNLILKAIEYFTIALHIFPTNYSFYMKRTRAYFEIGYLNNAISDISFVIANNPNDKLCYLIRGYFYYYNGDFENAKLDFNKTLVFEPNNSDYNEGRGRINLVLGNIKEGFDDCNKAIELSDTNSLAYLNRSIANLLLGNKFESRKDYEKAVQLANEQNDDGAKKEIAKCFDSDGNLLKDWNVPKR